MLPLQTSLKTKKKNNLKCDLMVEVLTSAGIVLIPFWLQRKKFQLDLNFRPQGSKPDALLAHVYCNVTKFNLLY